VSFDGLEPSILMPAFVAGLLVLTTHVPLGRQVLARGIIFIDLAVAQFAGLGVILGDTLGIAQDGWAIQLTAFGAALAGAALLYGCERRRPEILEALIGSSFVVAASLAVLLLAGDPHGGEQLKDLLVGQVGLLGSALGGRPACGRLRRAVVLARSARSQLSNQLATENHPDPVGNIEREKKSR